MLKIEKLLNLCDKAETDMLFALLKGSTYSELSEKFHMSVNGIKYKLNKFFELCQVKSKKEFSELLSRYI